MPLLLSNAKYMYKHIRLIISTYKLVSDLNKNHQSPHKSSITLINAYKHENL